MVTCKPNCIKDVLNQGKVTVVHFILRKYFSGVQGIFLCEKLVEKIARLGYNKEKY